MKRCKTLLCGIYDGKTGEAIAEVSDEVFDRFFNETEDHQCQECKELLKQIEKLETRLKLAEYLNDELRRENRQIQREMWLMSLR